MFRRPDRSQLRPGVRAAWLVRRRLRVAAGVEPDAAPLEAVLGFNRLCRQGDLLVLEYDASRVQIDRLLELLAAQGIGPLATAGNRFRLGWYRWQDHNIAANARDESTTSCAQSPLRFR